ncbi:MAG: hypothetical protein HY827_00020 [Actinobacteria bacterium]|nr:hypothetical protein [Actinomycetota bacterium]
MLCCIVLLAVVGLVFRRNGVDDPLPPPARRTVEGALAPMIVNPSPNTSAAPFTSTATTATTATLCRWGAIGVAFYVSAITALLACGAASALDDSGAHWLMRDLSFAIVASFALVISERMAKDRRRALHRPTLALIGVGAAWTVLGFIDMHVFGLIEIAHGAMLWDAVFHAAGFWAVIGGLLLLNRREMTRPAPGAVQQVNFR